MNLSEIDDDVRMPPGDLHKELKSTDERQLVGLFRAFVPRLVSSEAASFCDYVSDYAKCSQALKKIDARPGLGSQEVLEWLVDATNARNFKQSK